MNDFAKQHSSGTEGSRTIRVELPIDAFDGMRQMMSSFMGSGATESGCCASAREQCCPDTAAEERFEFTVILKRKE